MPCDHRGTTDTWLTWALVTPDDPLRHEVDPTEDRLGTLISAKADPSSSHRHGAEPSTPSSVRTAGWVRARQGAPPGFAAIRVTRMYGRICNGGDASDPPRCPSRISTSGRYLAWGRVQQMQFRRRVPRQPAGWDGVCQIEGEFAARCRIIDISMLGVGITLDHPSPYALVGRHISVDVPAVGDSASIRLEGKITNAKLTLRTTVRVGIEFDSPSPDLVTKVGSHAKAGVRRIRAR